MSQSFGKETSLLCLQQAVCSSPTAGDPAEKTGTASWPQARCSFWIRDCTKNKSKWGQIGTFLSSASQRITTPSPAGPSLANASWLLIWTDRWLGLFTNTRLLPNPHFPSPGIQIRTHGPSQCWG